MVLKILNFEEEKDCPQGAKTLRREEQK